MATETEPIKTPGVWATYHNSPIPVKTILVGVLLSKLVGFLNIFIVLYLTSRGYSPERAALALSVYGAGAVAGSFIGGALALRLGARNSTVISMSCTAVLTVSLLYLPNYSLLLLAIVGLSVAAQIYRPAATTLMSELTPKRNQVMIFALYRFSLNVGTTAAPLIGFALYYLDHKNYLLLFWAEGIVALFYAVLATIAIPSRTQHDAGPEGAKRASSAACYRAMFRDRRYLLYLLGNLINVMIYTQYMSTLPLDVKATGVPIFWYTFALSLNSLMVITCEIPLTKIVQKWPIRVPVGLMFILVGLGMATYGLPLGPAVIVGGTLIWTMGEVVGGPAVLAYPAIAGPDELRSSYIGSFQFVFAVGTAIGPALGIALFVHLGHKVWWALVPVSALAAYLGMTGIRMPGKKVEIPVGQTGTSC
jgi:MFS family permease